MLRKVVQNTKTKQRTNYKLPNGSTIQTILQEDPSKMKNLPKFFTGTIRKIYNLTLIRRKWSWHSGATINKVTKKKERNYP